jgi:hypothetical protein
MGAILTIILVAIIIWAILMLLIKKTDEARLGIDNIPKKDMKECAICEKEYERETMIERAIGELEIKRYFCGNCLEQLYNEYKMKPQITNIK